MRMPGSFSIAGKYKTGRLQLLLINTIVLKSPFCKNPKIRKNRMPVCIFLIGSQPGYFVFRTVFNFYDICPVPVDHQYCQQPAGRDNLHADMQLHNRDIDTAGKCSAHAGSDTILPAYSTTRNTANGTIRYHALWKVKMDVDNRNPNIVATAFPPRNPANTG